MAHTAMLYYPKGKYERMLCKMSEMIIRPYHEQDWKRIEAIHDAARMDELRNAGLPEAFVPLAEAAESEDLFDYTMYVAVLDDTVVGFVAHSEDELAWLYIDPAYMRRGIGKALVQHVIDTVTERPLCIEVLTGNDPAVRLYEAMGFKTIEMLSGKMPGNETFQVTVHSMQLP